jgi:glycosyltransferase involved in cell wall biosynthesis
MNNPSPFVSIFMMTYNHERYIAKALDSILSQKVNFDYEIVLGEDCSSDKTREIVLSYKRKYADLIKLLLHDQNLGASNNQIVVIEKCTGKYIAILEGDDYWIDPYKLQKQVDFLEANPDYGMIATDIILVDQESKTLPDTEMLLKQRTYRKEDIGFFDLLHGNLINTLTVCVRADLMKSLAEETERRNLWFAIDKWFWLNIALKHKIRLSYEKTAAYRVHPEGVSRARNFIKERSYFIYHDVLVKLFATVNVKKLGVDNKVTLARRCSNLIVSGNLGIRERLFLIRKIVMNPSLFMAMVVLLRKRMMN